MTNEVFDLNNRESYKEFLAIQAIQLRWGWFYDVIIIKTEILLEIKKLLNDNKDGIVGGISNLEIDFKNLILDNEPLMEFLNGT